MEGWQVSRYEMPRLVPLSARLEQDGRTVVLTAESIEYEIASEEVDGREVLDSVRAMSDPNAQIWNLVKDGTALPWQTSLAKQLDELSLVQSRQADPAILTEQATLCEKWIDEATQMLIQLAETREEAFRAVIPQFLLVLDTLPPKVDEFSVIEIQGIDARENFALQVFFLQKLYVEENLPVVADYWRKVFRQVAAHLAIEHANTSSVLPQFAVTAGFYCPAHIRAYLMCAVDLVHLASSPDSVRRIHGSEPGDEAETGLNFMRKAERFALEGLAQLGESRYAAKIHDKSAAFGPLVQGLFIEQYHVTQRFVEVIAPLMTKRSRSPVKQRTYRYFQEELGHEAFERATCEAIGVSREVLDTALPLPLFQAYVDAFTVLGKYDPIGYMSSIIVTEGMLGVDNPVHERLEQLASSRVDYRRVAKRHDDLNIELNHASLSRLFFEELTAIAPDVQRRALENLSFLIELNFRAMDQAADFYGGQLELTACSLSSYMDLLS